MSASVFRRATADDVADIVALLADDALGAAREVITDPPAAAYRHAFDAIDRDRNQLLAVADTDGAVGGCLQLSFIPGLSLQGAWRGQIESVRIAKQRRGAGLGTRFFRWAIERCIERGCSVVQLTHHVTRNDASRFYRRLGFEPTHVGMKLKVDGHR